MSARLAVTLALALALAPDAHAIIYVGNPDLGFRVDRAQHDLVGGAVHLQTIRVHACGGGYTDYTVNQDIDPVAGYSRSITGGDLCAVTFYWSTDMDLDVSGAGGDFSMVYADNSTTVTLGSPIQPVQLTSAQATTGSWYGNKPVLVTTLQ